MAMVNPDLATICGAYCANCEDLETCGGCASRIARMADGPCDRYHCCTEVKRLEHCGLCDEFPCASFDVNCTGLPDELFGRVRERTISQLRRRAEVGTMAGLREVHIRAGSD